MKTSTAQKDTSTSGGIQVIARAASVLRALEGQPQGLSLGQIAKAVGLARSTVQRIVGALAAEGFVMTGEAGGARIGPGLLQIAASLRSDMAVLVKPHLRALSEELEETVDLSILSGGSVVFIDQVQGKQRLAALSTVGTRFPLHCSANGKAILSCFSEEDAEALIRRSVEDHPDFPLKSLVDLRKELATTRLTKLAYDLEEHGEGISAVGIALPGLFGSPIAISIPVPTQRFAARKDEVAAAILTFRERIRPILTA